MENSILKALSEPDHARLSPHLTRFHARQETVLYQSGQPARYLYFPCGSQVSMVAVTPDGASAESGVVGHEGIAGLPSLLGDGETPHRCVVQVPGDLVRLPQEAARAEFGRCGRFQAMVLLYVHYLLVQVAQTTVCNRAHPIEKRLARWLLLVSDAVGDNRFHLTHEFLSTMLGAHRPGVSHAAGCLQDAGLIQYHRGEITIEDRPRLIDFSCDCYPVIRAERDRFLDGLSAVAPCVRTATA